MPPQRMLASGKHTDKFFKKVPEGAQEAGPGTGNGSHREGSGGAARQAWPSRSSGSYQLLSCKEFEERNGCAAAVGKRYFSHTALADIISRWGAGAAAA